VLIEFMMDPCHGWMHLFVACTGVALSCTSSNPFLEPYLNVA
jgi:hypothetical protein